MARPLVVLALVTLLVLAGCGGPGDRTPQPLEDAASPATVEAGALTATDYQEAHVESERVTRTGTIDVSGDVDLRVNYRANVTARRADYRHRDADPPAVFAVYSVPLVSPDSVDVTIDPLGDRSPGEVAAGSQTPYSGFENLEHVENASATLLGIDTTLRKYEGTASEDGATVDVAVYIATVEHDGDVVRAVAVQPRADDDRDPVTTLLDGVQH